MNNLAAAQDIALWQGEPEARVRPFDGAGTVLRRVWIKAPFGDDVYLCAQKMSGNHLDWRILVLKSVSYSDAGSRRPVRFQRKSVFTKLSVYGVRDSWFSYDDMMDILWGYFDPAVYDPLRAHKDHFVQEMARYAISHDQQDRILCFSRR